MIQTQQQQPEQHKRQSPTSTLFSEIAPEACDPLNKRRKVSNEVDDHSPPSKVICDFYHHPLSFCMDPPSSSSHVRQEQIDQLRSRVDSVLKSLVQGTDSDAQALKNQLQSLREGPDDAAVSNMSMSRPVSDEFEHQGGEIFGQNGITKTVEQQWIVDPYGDQGEFFGDLNADNLPHGVGVMKYSDGRIYSGEWKNGRWHGKGRATFSNGDFFEGMYYEDQRHGDGVYQWSDGREFRGGFVNDQRSGHGEYSWPDGAMYVGEFQKGLRHGEGTYTFSDGSFYRGSWVKGKYHGKGEVCRGCVIEIMD
jgi:hypothetical protein